MQWLRDKFEVLLVSVIFGSVFWIWVQSDYRGDVKEFLIAIFGAWLALLRVVQRPSNVQADTITTDSIDTAKTESGDIVSGTSPKKAIKSKE